MPMQEDKVSQLAVPRWATSDTCKNNPRLETEVIGSEGLEEVQDTEEDTDEFKIH